MANDHRQFDLDETYWCRKDTKHKAVIDDWNRSEYLSAIQKPWMDAVEDKTKKGGVKDD